VKPVAVEAWLDGIKRANDTKAKIRNLMSAVFQHAMRYEWMDRNPIQLVRQSAKREKVPDVPELAELQLLLTKLDVRERTLVLLDSGGAVRVHTQWTTIGSSQVRQRRGSSLTGRTIS
jgi:site-specific recombinase XerD